MRPDPFAMVVALDIDGTAGDYHSHFTKFAEAYVGKPMPPADQYTGGVPFHKHLGVSRSTYNTMKLAYRQGGMKRSMPPYEGIGDLTRYIRSRGVQVWICTTRPYMRLDNIDPDTRHWLRKRAHIQYDGILYGTHKYRDLVRAVGLDRVLVVYDDLPAQIEVAMGLGLDAALRTQPYNTYWSPSSGTCVAVSSVEDMRKVFDVLMEGRDG